MDVSGEDGLRKTMHLQGVGVDCKEPVRLAAHWMGQER